MTQEWRIAMIDQVKYELTRGFHNGGDWEPDAIIRCHQILELQSEEIRILREVVNSVGLSSKPIGRQASWTALFEFDKMSKT